VAAVAVVVMIQAPEPAKTAGLVVVAALKTLGLQLLQAVRVTRHQHHHHKATTAVLGIPVLLEVVMKPVVVVVVLAQ
jgi:hypothetical protein